MKLKTKKAAYKRFKVTSKGKFLRMRQMASHLKASKSRSAKTRYKRQAFVSKPDKRVIEKLLPYAS